jgi:hypothetical protein
VALVRKRTIPTERPPLVGEVGANFCGCGVSHGQCGITDIRECYIRYCPLCGIYTFWCITYRKSDLCPLIKLALSNRPIWVESFCCSKPDAGDGPSIRNVGISCAQTMVSAKSTVGITTQAPAQSLFIFDTVVFTSHLLWYSHYWTETITVNIESKHWMCEGGWSLDVLFKLLYWRQSSVFIFDAVEFTSHLLWYSHYWTETVTVNIENKHWMSEGG